MTRDSCTPVNLLVLRPAGGVQPPSASAVSAATRKLLRGIVMEHETITEWDEPPGETHYLTEGAQTPSQQTQQ